MLISRMTKIAAMISQNHFAPCGLAKGHITWFANCGHYVSIKIQVRATFFEYATLFSWERA